MTTIFKDYPALATEHLAHAKVFATRFDLITELPIEVGSVIAEIDVMRGDFSLHIMNKLKPRKFVAFDTFHYHELPQIWGIPSTEFFDGLTQLEYFRRLTSNSSVADIECLSLESMSETPAGSFDLIYIGAGRGGDALISDTAHAVRMVTDSGILVFHNYIMSDPNSHAPYKVIPIVNDLIVNQGWRVIGFALRHDMFCDIAIQRNIKPAVSPQGTIQKLQLLAGHLMMPLIKVVDKAFAEIWLWFWRFNKEPCLAIGHRGTKALPENTLESLLRALAEGADGVEFDVVFTQDGIPVVCHDDDVSEQVAQHQRPAVISMLTLEQVQQLNIHQGYRVHTLAKVLKRLMAAGVRRVYAHYKYSNESRGVIESDIRAISKDISDAKANAVVVVMVESGHIKSWLMHAPEVAILQCWTGTGSIGEQYPFPINFTRQHGLHHIGFYYNAHEGAPWGSIGLNGLGQHFEKLGLHHIGLIVGLWLPVRQLIKRHKHQGLYFVIFTINHPFLIRLFAATGMNAIGADAPMLLKRIIA